MSIDYDRPAGGLDVLDPDVTPDVSEPGDHERMAHYVDKRKLPEAYVYGAPVTALCGKTWTPSRDPEKFPVCQTCVEVLDMIHPLPPGEGQ